MLVVVTVQEVQYTAVVVENQDGDWEIERVVPEVPAPLRAKVERALWDAAEETSEPEDTWSDDDWDDYDVDGDL